MTCCLCSNIARYHFGATASYCAECAMNTIPGQRAVIADSEACRLATEAFLKDNETLNKVSKETIARMAFRAGWKASPNISLK